MAELFLKVGSHPDRTNYQDGDIIDCFNRRRRECVYQQHIYRTCMRAQGNPDRKIGVRGQLRPHDPISRSWLDETYQHRFEQLDARTLQRVDTVNSTVEVITGPSFDIRLGALQESISYTEEVERNTRNTNSKTSWSAALIAARIMFPASEVDFRTRTLDGQRIGEVMIDSKPYRVAVHRSLAANGYVDDQQHIADGWISIEQTTPEFCYVKDYVKRRLKHPTHRIFEHNGLALWHGGKQDHTQTTLNKVWTTVEAESADTRNDHKFKRWPAGRRDLTSHLAIVVNDMDDAMANDLVSPEYEDNQDPEQPPVIVQKRRHEVKWRDELGLTGAEIDQADDPRQTVDWRGVAEDPADVRPVKEFVWAEKVRQKPSRRSVRGR